MNGEQSASGADDGSTNVIRIAVIADPQVVKPAAIHDIYVHCTQ